MPEGRVSGIRSLMLLFVLLLLAFLASCAVGPNYKRPSLAVPQNFRDGPSNPGTNSLADLPWWQVFRDATLQDLIRMSLTNSYDIRVAITRVEQARAILEQNRAAFFPSLNYQGTVSRGKNAGGTTPVSTGGQTVDVFLLAGNASWEVDLWGRIRRLNESARAQFLASKEAQRDVLISVISQVAQAYFELLALDRQLEIAQRTTNSFTESLRIFSQRLQGGIVSRLETARAEAALASTAATVPDLQRRIIIQENLINVLVGRNPAPVPRNQTLLQQEVPPEIPAGLPSTLLLRRPDIRQTEQFLRSANAQVGAAVADFFPRLSLTGLFGQTSPELSAFTSGGANAWSVAAGLTGPIFQGGRLLGQYRQAQAFREESLLRFQSTVNNAFQEISNDLTTIRTLAEVRVHQARAVKANQEAVQVSMQRYTAGRAGYFELLEAQQQLFPAENSLVQVQLNQLLAVVQLYRALGGGFGPEEIEVAKKHTPKKP
ncbi:MAG: efflux system, outer rane lipoprotein NodT family [Verrucomicrobiales bacterium]|nr:efflux system, outer rane lipoprotein NodT family [Verrucomicrobiales bacterium]